MTDPLKFEEEPPTSQEEAEHPGRVYQRPVAWLFGRQLVRSLKYTLVYTAFGNKLDPRDWMNPRAYSFAAGSSSPVSSPPVSSPPGAAAGAASAEGGAAANACPAPWQPGGAGAGGEREFWFDYLSDTGDGVKAVYSLAYLCMSDLWVKDPGGRMPERVEDAAVAKEDKGAGYLKMPRGEFLMVGGDTAYHMSDYATLAERFQTPFHWAFKDLQTNLGKLFDDATRRPIFGIPGNHDYYDQLDGFRRQFRRTIRPEPAGEPADPNDYRNPQLLISGFVRCQEASYVALELPHDWWLWGLDTEVGKIDERQRKFFQKLASKVMEARGAAGLSERKAPAALPRLIVATCAPTTVFGKYPDRDDEKSSRAFFQLGLPRPFIEDGKLERNKDGELIEPTLGDEQCRLDISGDVHHYARYWGPGERQDPRVRERGGDRRGDARSNYASVVSGIGGAFHHPSQTYKGEIEERALYPSEHVSRKEVAKQVFRFWNLINGGGVWLVGLILAFVIYFGLTVSQSSREFFHSVCFWEPICVLPQEAVTPTVPVLDMGTVVEQFFGGEWPVPGAKTGGVCDKVTSGAPDCAKGCYPPRYFLGPCAVEGRPGQYWGGVGMTVAALLLVVITFLLSSKGWLFDDPDLKHVEEQKGLPPETDEEAAQRKKEEGRGGKDLSRRHWYEERPFQRVAMLAVPTMLLAALALATLKPFRPHITPFGNSLLVLAAFICAAGAVALNVRYTEWLFEKASVRKLHRGDWAMTWVLGAFAVVTAVAGLWLFGQNNRAANLAADIIFALVLLGSFVGVSLLGYFKAGEMRDGYVKKLPFLGIGLFHAALQLATAFLLVRKAALPAWLLPVPTPGPGEEGTFSFLAAAVAASAGRLIAITLIVLFFVGLFGLLGWWLMRENRRWLLLATWVAHGLFMLFLPWMTWSLFGRPGGTFTAHSGLLPAFYNQLSWWGTLPSVLAALLGALLCCIWLGWYFAVSLAFHGHNNEIAGAARIERFKEFVRIRINKDGLTGYVIAVDYPKRNGKDLRPRLVDVFHLRPKS